MLRTPLCDLLGIEVPVIGAPFGPLEEVDLAAAVCAAGGLGSVGTGGRPVDGLREQWARLRRLTDRPFAINHTMRPFDEEAFRATLRARPAAVSFHIGVHADLVARARDAGVPWIQQVQDLAEAEQAVAAGVDVIVAQGGEAGGHGGEVATMVLVPQVVDVAGGIPVVAAGGIADGRGLAAALALGAQGAVLGTRLLASTEMAVADAWKRRIVDADAGDAVKIVRHERILPPFSRPGCRSVPRSLRTPFLDELADHPERFAPATTGPRLLQAAREGRAHEYVPLAGQSAGLVHDIAPAGEIVRRVVAQAEDVLRSRAAYVLPYGG
ncbi:NAD(P)H-dependent flavin oxidoreductase [Streptomyces sp. NPDC018693]|uniref:NAD(P)H-dependent flavin oxidoreductase n=1 Tax=unclassified Streptomyces TaxID=2593676 RepID=UPI00378E6D45